VIITAGADVAPASCRLSRGRLALGGAGEDARRTPAGTAALRLQHPATASTSKSYL